MERKERIKCCIVYHYLKKNCVGIDNAKGGSDICAGILANPKTSKFFSSDFNKVGLQAIINKLRKNQVDNMHIRRRIGSSRKGYWLDTKKSDNGLEFLKRLAVSHITTAVKSGVPTNYFYQILNKLENQNLVDKQQLINLGHSKQKEVTIFSDDLEREVY